MLSACVASERHPTWKTPGSISPEILYIFGIISISPCEAVNVVASAPAASAPCVAPAAPSSDSRQWANKVLKEYLLRGYAVNQRLMQMEERIDRRLSEHDRKLEDLRRDVDFFVRTSLPPREGIFFDGQIFDAYAFVADLIRKAKRRIVVIDSYVDDSVLVQLSKRHPGVTVDIS